MRQKNQFGQLLGHLVENWIPCQRPAKTTIQGRYCILEPKETNKHTIKLFDGLAIDNQGESWTYLPYGPLIRSMMPCFLCSVNKRTRKYSVCQKTRFEKLM